MFLKRFLILVSILSIVVFPPTLLAFYPGILTLPHLNRLKFKLSGALILSIAISLSFWIVAFWWLKYLPVTLTQFLIVGLAVSAVMFVLQRPVNWKMTKTDYLDFLFLLALLAIFSPFYVRYFVPPAADMATYTYFTRQIVEINGFPRTLEPMLPVDHFGSSPLGLSILAAATTLLSSLPVYKATLALSFLSYPLVGIGLYLLLKNWFPTLPSLCATLALLFLNPDLTEYFTWGGNTTILAIALLYFFLLFLLKLNPAPLSFPSITIAALLYFAAFTTHQIPLVVSAPILVLFIGASCLKKPNLIWPTLSFLTLLVALAIPFMTSFTIPTTHTQTIIKQWNLDNNSQLNWQNGLATIPLYLKTQFESVVFTLALVGLILSFRLPLAGKRWWYLALLCMAIIFLNNKVQILPLTPLLYPDRTVATYSLVIAALTAFTVNQLFRLKTLPRNLVLIFLVAMVVIPSPIKASLHRSKAHWQNRLNLHYLTLVTPSDLAALKWLTDNTPPTALIDNRYGDAGIWVPSIAYRKVVINDAAPYEFDDVKLWQLSHPEPDYAFIGANHYYGHPEFTESDLVKKPEKYRLVFSSGGSKIFKVIK